MNTPRGWILYDGSCGFCSRWVPWFDRTLARRGLDYAPLQESWVRERLDLPEQELLDDLRLLLADGTLISGANVYRFVMRRTWWAWPIYLLSITPGLRWLFDRAYRGFANRRYQVSRFCRLP